MLHCIDRWRHGGLAFASHRRAWLHVWAVLLCAAFLFQSVVAQSHAHFGSPMQAAEFSGSNAATEAPSVGSGDHSGSPADPCFLCRVAAGSHYLPPPADAAPPAMPKVLWVASQAMTRFAMRQPHRGWFGRAPPQ